MVAYLTNTIKPWEQLNAMLAQQFALQPDITDVTRNAALLAVSIKHELERTGYSIKQAVSESHAFCVMNDVADYSKHGSLFDPRRDSPLTTSSLFEGNGDGKFRFLRNIVHIQHSTYGKLDFMLISREAINYSVGKMSLPIQWKGFLAEGNKDFTEEVILYLSTRYQVDLSSLNIEFVLRQNDGSFLHFDPPTWKFILEEINPRNLTSNSY